METTYPEKCERYIQNLRRVRALSKPQFAPGTAPEALLEEIQNNAVCSFGLMQENNALLNELVYVLDPKTLTDEEITTSKPLQGGCSTLATARTAAWPTRSTVCCWKPPASARTTG